VWWSLRDVGREERPSQGKSFRAQFLAIKEVLKNPIVLSLVLAAALRGVGISALSHWTPFYLEEELRMGHFSAGVHFALLTGMGIAAAPVLGVLSDRFSRKMVLVPGLMAAAVLSFLVVSTRDSFLLPLVLAGLGIFTFPLHQIILAAVLDVTGRGTEAAATGFIFAMNGIINGGSVFIATAIIAHLGGYGSIFYYSGILTALSALLVLMIPLAPHRAAPTSAL
jgi:sugar phosphate permease